MVDWTRHWLLVELKFKSLLHVLNLTMWASKQIWASKRENLSSIFVNNKGADQSAHPRSLICAFVIRLLENCSKRNFTILASLCSWGDWFESCFIGNPEDRFCHDKAHIITILTSEVYRILYTMGSYWNTNAISSSDYKPVQWCNHNKRALVALNRSAVLCVTVIEAYVTSRRPIFGPRGIIWTNYDRRTYPRYAIA